MDLKSKNWPFRAQELNNSLLISLNSEFTRIFWGITTECDTFRVSEKSRARSADINPISEIQKNRKKQFLSSILLKTLRAIKQGSK